ncbi:MAG: carboxynorspermidine decarboxylase [Cellvibrionaceae bacterium]|nr:carboxynorspermidine decarboxylase [Cellvibrionaceae bacterium]
MTITTPYYLIDEQRMLPAMEKIRYLQQRSGAKSLLALKCFSSWCAFDFMRGYMAGTTSSSLYEARLGHETFGGENHGYAVAYSEADIQQTAGLCDKIIFNSVKQLTDFKRYCKTAAIGLRLNPEIGFSAYSLSDTVCQYSHLGVTGQQLSDAVIQQLDGVMLHMNCENADFDNFSKQLAIIDQRFSPVLQHVRWLSLGGGIAFTHPDYPLDNFAQCLLAFSRKFKVQIYLEPGEAAITASTSLVVTVLDIVDNGLPTLIVDAGVETHLLDVLTYQYTPALTGATAITADEISAALQANKTLYRVCGRTCLSGDVFGYYIFEQTVSIGSQLVFSDAGGYSIVKKNFFNGIRMPAICHKKLNGDTRLVREFNYHDFKQALS